MSIHVVSWVLKHSGARHGERLVLISLADHARDDGTSAWPSVATLARDSRLSRKGVQDALRRLEAGGHIARTGVSAAGTTIYQVVMGGEEATPREESVAGGEESGARGEESDPKQGPFYARTTTNPSKTRQGPVPSPVVGDLFSYWQEQCNHPAAKLTAERKRKLAARLADGYTAQQIKRAIDGAAARPFVNERGVRFDDIELICRNGSKLESFIARAPTDDPSKPNPLLGAVCVACNTWLSALEVRQSPACACGGELRPATRSDLEAA